MSDNGLITITYDPEMFKIVDAIAQEYDVPKSEIFNRAILIASAKVEEKLKTNLSGKILKVVTGHLRQSIDTKIEKDRDGIRAIIGSGTRVGGRVAYADILETGGIIEAKRARFLTIPIGENKTKTEKIAYRARDFENTFIRKGIIFQNLGKGNIRPLFLLKSAVTIPDFKYVSETAKQMKDVFIKSIEEAIREIIKKYKNKKDNKGNNEQ